jgi:succinate-semialdehyde dehydrogenase/glutarate-semialdehyde dehydrogenase
VAKGARVVTGGKRHALGGTFFEPTVLADVTPDMRLAREEIFGPVAPLFRFKDEAEAIAHGQRHRVRSRRVLLQPRHRACFRVGEALEYGMVGVNTGVISNEVAPFGGVKQSGLGREGSKYGIEEYLEIKYLPGSASASAVRSAASRIRCGRRSASAPWCWLRKPRSPR